MQDKELQDKEPERDDYLVTVIIRKIITSAIAHPVITTVVIATGVGVVGTVVVKKYALSR